MNIHHRLQQLNKENIQQICSQIGIKNHGDQNKAQLITRLLLPLQTYKMERTRNTSSKGKKTEVKSQSYYDEEEMKRLTQKLHNLNIKPYIPTEEQKKRILELMKK